MNRVLFAAVLFPLSVACGGAPGLVGPADPPPAPPEASDASPPDVDAGNALPGDPRTDASPDVRSPPPPAPEASPPPPVLGRGCGLPDGPLVQCYAGSVYYVSGTPCAPCPVGEACEAVPAVGQAGQGTCR